MNAVELYQSPTGAVSLEVTAEGDTVWLSRYQMAELFGRDVKTLGKHIGNALREELEGEAVVAKFATTAADGKTYKVEHYNLDMIISVGYRVKSVEGVHFRRWANGVLRRYLADGVAVNERRLETLGQIVTILARSTDELVAGVADVVSRYLPGLRLLRDYDQGAIQTAPAIAPGWQLDIDDARKVISAAASAFPDDALFGLERGGGLQGIVATIYQSFDGQPLYRTVEEQAANLLYLVVKDHPLVDGNKRSAAALFVTFLDRNQSLSRGDGNLRISNNALAATVLMISMSDPREKDLMIALVVRMLGVETA